jgi:hypothetical protein
LAWWLSTISRLILPERILSVAINPCRICIGSCRNPTERIA